MANLRAIRTRIKSVENTRQITKSMKMVAAAKLRKTQAAFAGLRGYADSCGALLEEASAGMRADSDSPYLKPPAGTGRTCYVLVVGNRGLCGTYNQALLRYCEQLIRERGRESLLYVCGRWGRDMIAAAGLRSAKTFEISDTPTHEEALALAEELKRLYRESEVDEIVLVYQHYRTVLSQIPETKRLLPLNELAEPTAGAQNASQEDGTAAPEWSDSTESDARETDDISERKLPEDDTIFEPDRASILNMLLDMYISNTVHAILLEARTGEHSARMTAMTAAADNTEELIRELTLELNHARQAAITTEISEIAGGAEALRNNTAGG